MPVCPGLCAFLPAHSSPYCTSPGSHPHLLEHPGSGIFFAVLQCFPIHELTSLNTEKLNYHTPPGPHCLLHPPPAAELFSWSFSLCGEPLVLETPLSSGSMKALPQHPPLGPCLLLPFPDAFPSSHNDLIPSLASAPPMHQRFHISSQNLSPESETWTSNGLGNIP